MQNTVVERKHIVRNGDCYVIKAATQETSGGDVLGINVSKLTDQGQQARWACRRRLTQ